DRRAGQLPAARPLGRLARVRVHGVAEKAAAPLHAGPDDVLQLRVGLWPARVRRSRHAAGAQVRGQPAPSGQPRPPLREGAGHYQPDLRSRAHPLPAEAGWPARGGQWERTTWDAVLDDYAQRIRAALLEGRQNEIVYHVGRPGEDGYMERVLQAWGID